MFKNKKTKLLLFSLTASASILSLSSLIFASSCKKENNDLNVIEQYSKTLQLLPTKETEIDENRNLTAKDFIDEVQKWQLFNSEGIDEKIKISVVDIYGISIQNGRVYLKTAIKISLNQTSITKELNIDITNFLKEPKEDQNIDKEEKDQILAELKQQEIEFKFTNKNVKPSEVSNDQIEIQGLNEENFSYLISDLVANNKKGTLTIKAKLFSKKHPSLRIAIEKKYEGFKIDQSTPEPGPGPIVPPTPAPDGDTYNVRLAHWNICNFGDNALKKRKPKGQAIAAIIHRLKLDVCGLTEVDGLKVIPAIADLLNEIEQSKGSNVKWSYILGDYKKSNGRSIEQAAHGDKAAGFVYKTNIVKPITFKDGSVGKFYDNSNFVNKFGGGLNEYERTPYCVKWQANIEKMENVNFSFAISHFDGPGDKNKNGEIKAGIGAGVGSCEANEAYNIPNVLSWLQEQADGDDDLIFQGDTNIPESATSQAFASLTSEHKMLIDGLTSLDTSGGLSSSYDKIVHFSNLRAHNAGIYNIWNFPDDKEITFPWYNQGFSGYDSWLRYCESQGTVPARGAIYNYLSDHCPTYYDLELNANDPK